VSKSSVLTIVVLAGMAFMQPTPAADLAAGKKLVESTCSACHGKDGISVASIYPNLAGQKTDYMVAQLKAFRDGTRPNPIMVPIAKSLSEADITNVTAYLSTLKGP
jgi:cytochrome c553